MLANGYAAGYMAACLELCAFLGIAPPAAIVKITCPAPLEQCVAEDLRRLYWDEGMTLNEMGELFFVSAMTVYRRMIQLGIPRHTSSRHTDQKRARRILCTGPVSSRELAERLQIQPHSAYARLHRLEQRGLARHVGNRWVLAA